MLKQEFNVLGRVCCIVRPQISRLGSAKWLKLFLFISKIKEMIWSFKICELHRAGARMVLTSKSRPNVMLSLGVLKSQKIEVFSCNL